MGVNNFRRGFAAEKVGKRRAKSAKFRRFVDEYRKTGNAYQSALRAGYSPKMAKGRSYELARLVRASDMEAPLSPADSRQVDSNPPAIPPVNTNPPGLARRRRGVWGL